MSAVGDVGDIVVISTWSGILPVSDQVQVLNLFLLGIHLSDRVKLIGKPPAVVERIIDKVQDASPLSVTCLIFIDAGLKPDGFEQCLCILVYLLSGFPCDRFCIG